MSWNIDEEKLLCLMVMDDDLAPAVSDIGEGAFFRAFIVQNRATGAVSAKMRWSYKEPKGKSWAEIKTREADPQAALKHLQSGIEMVIECALTAFGVKRAANAMHSFYPPDDGGNPDKTIAWLTERDLIEVTRVEVNGKPIDDGKYGQN